MRLPANSAIVREPLVDAVPMCLSIGRSASKPRVFVRSIRHVGLAVDFTLNSCVRVTPITTLWQLGRDTLV
jgi:hypothetical protein